MSNTENFSTSSNVGLVSLNNKRNNFNVIISVVAFVNIFQFGYSVVSVWKKNSEQSHLCWNYTMESGQKCYRSRDGHSNLEPCTLV